MRTGTLHIHAARRRRLNRFSVGPLDGSAGRVDCASVVFPLRAAVLSSRWHAAAARLDRTRLVAAADGCFEYEVRSRVFGFRDRVTLRFVALGADRSTVAIDSRSLIGWYDFGVNRRRVLRWLALMDEPAGAAGSC